MPTTAPPRPPQLAERIALDTAARVTVDLDPLVPAVVGRLRRSKGRRDWIEIEGLAKDVLAPLWESELRESVALALADVHELALLQAVHAQEAVRLLVKEGRESWIGGAVCHELAGRLAWRVCEAEGLLVD